MNAEYDALLETLRTQLSLSRALCQIAAEQRRLLGEQRERRQALRGQLLAHRAALRLTLAGLRWAVKNESDLQPVKGAWDTDGPN
ncbi:MAG: hypothetical protein M5U01_05410 [Ardenticatenaceae bacterium]|nr:hypothetical protein [Ardenticatenaceae bacterium]